MDWIGIIVNMTVIFVGLFLYLGIMHTEWGKAHEKQHFIVMLVALLVACVVAGGLRMVLENVVLPKLG